MAVALHELGHGAALDAHAGADEGHLVGQVQQAAGPEPLAHVQLGRGLQQEDPLCLAPVNQVIHLGGPPGQCG